MHRRAAPTLPTTADAAKRSGASATNRRKVRRKGGRSSNRLHPALVGALFVAAAVLLIFLYLRPSSRSDRNKGSWPSYPLRRPIFALNVPSSSDADADSNSNVWCPDKKTHLSREKLDGSLALGWRFLSDHQREVGNFEYEYDWRTGASLDDDSEVRQAGALWGMALIFHDQMDHAEREGVLSSSSSDGNGGDESDDRASARNVLRETAGRIKKAVDFFRTNSRVLVRPPAAADGADADAAAIDTRISRMRYIWYPDDSTEHSQGTQALVCLALIDLLRGLGSTADASVAGVTASEVDDIRLMLDELLPFLVTQHASIKISKKDTVAGGRFQAWDELVAGGNEVIETGLWIGAGELRMGSDPMIDWWQQRELKRGNKNNKGYFYKMFDEEGQRTGRKPSPYYDGESILAVTKAAKYLGPRYAHLWPIAAGTAKSLHELHVVESLEDDPDSDDTKGVYQWLSMSLFELATVSFGDLGTPGGFDLPATMEDTYNANRFGKWLVDLAEWMVDVHETLRKTKNTGYAYEGIVPAWTWAAHTYSSAASSNHGGTKLADTAQKLHCTIEKGLDKLISWQVGMGAEKRGWEADTGEADASTWDGTMGLGGIQNAEDESGLRIDVTQHQMHATILTRRLVYPKAGAVWPWKGTSRRQA